MESRKAVYADPFSVSKTVLGFQIDLQRQKNPESILGQLEPKASVVS